MTAWRHREGGQAIVDAALDAFGTVDVVIHNAGVWRHESYEDMTPEMLDPVLDVHLRGAVFVTQPAYRIMQEKGYGRIVLTSSSTGCFGRVKGTNYAAAKAAMLGLARALSLECEEFGIKANCILPISPFGRKEKVPATFTDQLKEAGLAPELAGPEQVVPMVVWMASNACSVTGEGFSAGGGRYGRAFIAVADGWIAPKGTVATAEDIDAHVGEIRDLSSWDIPPTSMPGNENHLPAQEGTAGRVIPVRPRGQGRIRRLRQFHWFAGANPVSQVNSRRSGGKSHTAAVAHVTDREAFPREKQRHQRKGVHDDYHDAQPARTHRPEAFHPRAQSGPAWRSPLPVWWRLRPRPTRSAAVCPALSSIPRPGRPRTIVRGPNGEARDGRTGQYAAPPRSHDAAPRHQPYVGLGL